MDSEKIHEDGYRATNLTDDAAVDVDLSGPAGATASPNAAFAGNAVLTGWTSATVTGPPCAPISRTAGDRSSPPATSCLEGGRVLGDHGDWWRTCDWRGYGLRAQYTPDGERLLVRAST
jgi:hypothetical protein